MGENRNNRMTETENGADWVYGSGARYEWIRLSDAEQ